MPLTFQQDESAFEGKFLRVIRRHFLDRAGKPAFWEVVSRKTYGPIVAVLPVTTENELVLVRIYRVPARAYVLEMCAGLMDQPHEKPEQVAHR